MSSNFINKWVQLDEKTILETKEIFAVQNKREGDQMVTSIYCRPGQVFTVQDPEGVVFNEIKKRLEPGGIR